jgi:photosystem II PsbW protein
LYFKNHHFLF